MLQIIICSIIFRYSLFFADINDTTINRDNSLNHQTNVNGSKTENTWVRSIVFGIIGLAAVSIFLTIINVYTNKLEKRSTVLRTIQHYHIR